MPISASQIVGVTPQVLAAGGTALDLNGMLLTSSALMPPGYTFSFPSASAVIAFFGAASIETGIAAVYFQGYRNSNVKPGALLVSRYAVAPVAATLSGGNISGLTLAALQAMSGTLSVLVNGTAQSGTVNLSGATSFSAAAALIATALSVPVAFNSVSGGFVVSSSVTGSASSIAFATGTLADGLLLSQATGAIVAQGADQDTPGGAMPIITARNSNWASFSTTWEPSTADKIAFATWNNSTGKRFAYMMWDTDITATQLGQTGSAGYQITQVNSFDGTVPLYAPVNGALIGAFAMGYGASLAFSYPNGRATFFGRGLDGLAADVEDSTVATNLLANGYNFLGDYALANSNFTIIRNGTVSGQFQFLDSYLNQIWLNNQCQLALVGLITTSGSIPYNPQGYGNIESALLDPVQAGVNFGAIRVGVSLSNAQASALKTATGGKDIALTITAQGFYIFIGDPGAQVRGERGSPICILFYADGGSVQNIQLTSTEVQ